jgi:hypothetical protein
MNVKYNNPKTSSFKPAFDASPPIEARVRLIFPPQVVWEAQRLCDGKKRCFVRALRGTMNGLIARIQSAF